MKTESSGSRPQSLTWTILGGLENPTKLPGDADSADPEMAR